MNERLDHGLLEELKYLMEEDFTTLLRTYLEDAEQRLFEVSDAWEQGDFDALRRSAHSLKGSSSNVGAVQLAALCADLEQHAADGCAELLPQDLERVREEMREVRDAVTAAHPLH